MSRPGGAQGSQNGDAWPTPTRKTLPSLSPSPLATILPPLWQHGELNRHHSNVRALVDESELTKQVLGDLSVIWTQPCGSWQDRSQVREIPPVVAGAAAH